MILLFDHFPFEKAGTVDGFPFVAFRGSVDRSGHVVVGFAAEFTTFEDEGA